MFLPFLYRLSETEQSKETSITNPSRTSEPKTIIHHQPQSETKTTCTQARCAICCGSFCNDTASINKANIFLFSQLTFLKPADPWTYLHELAVRPVPRINANSRRQRLMSNSRCIGGYLMLQSINQSKRNETSPAARMSKWLSRN